MGRVGILVAAGVALCVAVVLTVLGVGETPGGLTNWQALVLGAVQGATELLPISSSGHLIVVPWLFDWTYLEQHPDVNKTFAVALHLGTLIAVVVYFWADLVRLAAAWWHSVRARGVRGGDERLAWYVLIATIPAVIAGAAGESLIEDHLGEPWQIAVVIAVFAALLYLADRLPTDRRLGDLTARRALYAGLAQVLALIPGVSRSGVVITAGRAMRLDRDAAARFSFLLLVPVVLGAAVFKGVKDVLLAGLPPGSAAPFVVGTVTAAVVGFAAIWLLLDYVRRHTYTLFVVYRLALAAFILVVIASGGRSATF
jgi:undecaprenyl-diphosphatase